MNNKTSVLFFLQKGLLQRCIAVAISLFVISPYLAHAQGGKITFVATSSKKEVTTGGSIQISFKLIGGVGGQLRQPNFGAFTMGRGTSETSGMQIINGEMQGHHTWTFNLVAPAPGDYTIPSATLDIKGKTYISDALKIKVVPAGKSQSGQGVTQIPQNADPNVFITTEFSVKSAYPGQQVIVMVYIYTQKNLAGLDMVRLPQPSKGQLKCR